MRHGPKWIAAFAFLLYSGVVSPIVAPVMAKIGCTAATAHAGPDSNSGSDRDSIRDIGGEATQPQVITTTMYVEDIAVRGHRAYVATRGGLEVYDLHAKARLRIYTAANGLAESHIYRVLVGPTDAAVSVRTRRYLCRLDRARDRFQCQSKPALQPEAPAVARHFAGMRVTVQAALVGAELVGTAGGGLWLLRKPTPDRPQRDDGERLSPRNQLCANHVMAMEHFAGRIYLGGFDGGLCVADAGAGRFRRLDTPFRMINDLAATPHGLYVAANAGLYHSVDGEVFRKIDFVSARGANGLAFDAADGILYATTPATLWRLPLGPRKRRVSKRQWRPRQFWLPGGARALQKVAVGAGAVWMASEDRGIIRFADGAFTVYDRAAGLPTSWIMDIEVVEEARGHTLYAASFRHGLLRVPLDSAHNDDDNNDGGPALHLTQSVPGLPDSWLLRVQAVPTRAASPNANIDTNPDANTDAIIDTSGAPRADIWVGTQNGAARLVEGTVVETVDALPHPCVHAVMTAGDRVWLATEGGLVLAATDVVSPR